MASKIRNRFTDTEMQIAKETDLPELLTHLGYQVRRIGRYHTTVEMDSLRIKDRRKWFRYSQNTGGDAITFLQQFCGKSFSEAVEYLLAFHGKARDSPATVVFGKPVSQFLQAFCKGGKASLLILCTSICVSNSDTA